MRVGRIVVAIAILASCIESELLICPDGTACGGKCTSAGKCATAEQVDACDDLAPYAACSVPAISDGVCVDGACVPAGCGNGIVETDEACDDGNRESLDGCRADCSSDETCGNGQRDALEECDDGNTTGGDGCQPTCTLARCGDGIVDIDRGEACDDGNTESRDLCRADCMSDESCGNGIIDFHVGEQCDDTNHASFDGCSSLCVVEQPRWTRESGSLSSSLAQVSLAFDPERRELVMFGGYDTNSLVLVDRTWLRRAGGVAWFDPQPPTSPAVRKGAAMAYDVAHHEMILFGGYVDSRDTWRWDGTTWSLATPTVKPSSRQYAAMVYDGRRHEIVLHGGVTNSFVDGDTWAWNGSSWRVIVPAASSPSPRGGAAYAYDPIRGRFVLYGGAPSFHDDHPTAATTQDLWEFDGTAWTMIAATNPPGARLHGAMAFDPTRGGVVLVGGSGGDSSSWLWNGTTWSALPAITTSSPALAFDGTRNRLVLWDSGQSFEWDGAQWSEYPLYVSPNKREGARAVFDGRNVMMFGGRVDDLINGFTNETWTWQQGTWVTQGTSGPAPRWQPSLAYDEKLERVVLFGGYSAQHGDYDDTWIWDGSTWSEISSSTRPPGRHSGGLAYDSARDRLVLYGGYGSSYVDDTWELAGTTWTQIPIAGPPARADHAMGYDPIHRQTVVYGGGGGVSPLDDTWAYDGTAWVQLAPTNQPGPRSGNLAWFAPRGRLVFYGSANDTWEWDGSDWSQLTSTSPPARNSFASAFDPLRAELVLFGGTTPTGSFDDTWRLRFVAGHTEACTAARDLDGDLAAGCADSDCTAYCTKCGDGTCDVIEDCRICPSDCGACAARCGDTYCDPMETAASCPGDCS